jgi:glutamate-1-semialdehyde 2,1-aminomutase
MTQEIADRIAVGVAKDDLDVGGIGGTLAGNALSLAALRATLTDVLTSEAYEHMTALGARWADGVDAAIAAVDAPWHCNRLGARGEYMFSQHAVRTGAEAFAACDHDLDEFLHLYALNRGILMTPFHNMALIAPSTTEADVDAHTAMFNELLGELFA